MLTGSPHVRLPPPDPFPSKPAEGGIRALGCEPPAYKGASPRNPRIHHPLARTSASIECPSAPSSQSRARVDPLLVAARKARRLAGSLPDRPIARSPREDRRASIVRNRGVRSARSRSACQSSQSTLGDKTLMRILELVERAGRTADWPRVVFEPVTQVLGVHRVVDSSGIRIG